MRNIKGKNTSPEIKVRKLVFSLGYRYRLHAKNLPGKPDLVFSRKKKVIFVHGCFWHYHGCKKGQPPKSRLDYWLPKLETNKKRDEQKILELESKGWKILVIWQCQITHEEEMKEILTKFLSEN